MPSVTSRRRLRLACSRTSLRASPRPFAAVGSIGAPSVANGRLPLTGCSASTSVGVWTCTLLPTWQLARAAPKRPIRVVRTRSNDRLHHRRRLVVCHCRRSGAPRIACARGSRAVPAAVLAAGTRHPVCGASFFASVLLGPKRPTAAKEAPYECGIVPEIEPAERFPVKFYLVAMAFIVLDVEIIFLYPFTTVLKGLAAYGLDHDGRLPARGAGAVRLPPLHRRASSGARCARSWSASVPGCSAPPVRPAATASTRPAAERGAADGRAMATGAEEGGVSGPRGRPAQLPDRPTRGPREVGPPQLGVAGHLRPRVLRDGDDGHAVPRTTTPPASAWRCSGPVPARPTS